MLSSASDNLACTDEVKVYEDEGEEEEQKISSENLTEDKVRLVIESETQIPRIFDFFGKNGTTSSLFKIPPFLTDPRLASYFLPGYPAAIAAAMATLNAAPASSSPSNTSSFINRSTNPSWSQPPAPPAYPSFWSHPPGGGGGSSSCSSSGYASSEGSVGANGWFHAAHSPASFNLSQYCYPHCQAPRSCQPGSSDIPGTGTQVRRPTENGGDGLSPYVNPALGLMPFYNRFAAMAAAAAAYSSQRQQPMVERPENTPDGSLEARRLVNGGDLRGSCEQSPTVRHHGFKHLKSYNQSPNNAPSSVPGTENAGDLNANSNIREVASLVSSFATGLPPTPAQSHQSLHSPSTPNNFYAACAAAMAAAAVASWNGSPPANPASTPHRKSPVPSPLIHRSGTPRNASPAGRSNLAAAAAMVAALSPAAAAIYQSGRSNVAASSCGESAVTSPYSPSMFAAAAAAHMQLLSAAVASLSSSQLSSTVCNTVTTTTSHANMVASPVNCLPRSSPDDTKMGEAAVWSRRASSWSNRSRGSRSGGFVQGRPINGSVSPTRHGRLDTLLRGSGRRNHAVSKSSHIKKPLNAFMLFMKEMRTRVQEECTLKESAAINQVLGKKWHELTREEQTKYYEMARQEKELHQQMYPNWSARDNYAYHARRRKRRRHLLHRHTINSRSVRRQSRVAEQDSIVSRPSAESAANTPTDSQVDSTGPPQLVRATISPKSTCSVTVSHQNPVHFSRRHSTTIARSPLSLLSLASPTLRRETADHTDDRPPADDDLRGKSSSPSAVESPDKNHVHSYSHATDIRPELASTPMGISRPSLNTYSHANCRVNDTARCPMDADAFGRVPSPATARRLMTPSFALPYSPYHRHTEHGTIRTTYPMQFFPRPEAFAPSRMSSPDMLSARMRGRGFHHHTSSNSVAAVAAAAAVAMAASELTGGSLKKCRARFGLEHQNMWCKPCRRKKKCIRFISDNDVDEFPLGPTQSHVDFHSKNHPRSHFMDPFSAAMRPTRFPHYGLPAFPVQMCWDRIRNRAPLSESFPTHCLSRVAPSLSSVDLGMRCPRFPGSSSSARMLPDPIDATHLRSGCLPAAKEASFLSNKFSPWSGYTSPNPKRFHQPLQTANRQLSISNSGAPVPLENLSPDKQQQQHQMRFEPRKTTSVSPDGPPLTNNKPELKRLTEMCTNFTTTPKRPCVGLTDSESKPPCETVRFGVADVLMSEEKPRPPRKQSCFVPSPPNAKCTTPS